MKKGWKCILYILLYLVVYFYMQIAVSTAFMICDTMRYLPDVMMGDTGVAYRMIDDVSAQIAWVMLVSIILSLLIYWAVLKLRHFTIRQTLSLNKINARQCGASILLAIGMEFIVVLILMLPFMQRFMPEFNSLMDSLTTGSPLLLFFVVGIAAPMIEELIFRGLILRELRQCLPIWPAIFIQAVLFGVYHFNFVQFIYATCIGIILGYVVYQTKSLYASLLIHVVYNSFNLIHEGLASFLPDWQLMVTIPLGIILIVIALAILKREANLSIKSQNNA